MITPGSAELKRLFSTFERSAYRLETLQSYGQSGEDAAFDAFLAGRPYVRPPGKVNWLNNIQRAVGIGASMSRVHVVREPLSPYLLFEVTWAYAPNVEAGEDIRIIPVGEGEAWPTGVPENHDYWLVDEQLFDMEYADDESRSWIGVHPVSEPALVTQALAWRDHAWQLAMPWKEYVESRPELAEIVTAMS